MRTKRYAKIGMAAACVAFFGACDNGDVLAPQGTLAPAEAEALNETIVGLAFQGWGFDQAAASRVPAPGAGVSMSVAGAPINIDWALSVSTVCDEGGTFGVDGSISGSIDDQTLAGTLSLDVATTMSDCGFLAEEQIFTFNTNPDLQLEGSVSWDQSGLVGVSTFTYNGGLDWAAADGRNGNCTFNVSVSLAQDGTETASGTVCGVTVDSGSL